MARAAFAIPIFAGSGNSIAKNHLKTKEGSGLDPLGAAFEVATIDVDGLALP